MKAVRWLLPIVAIAAFLFAAYFVFRALMPVFWVYSVEAEFGALPENDSRLEDWLASQPGVLPHTVRIRRTGDKSRAVRVVLMQLRNILGRPAVLQIARSGMIEGL